MPSTIVAMSFVRQVTHVNDQSIEKCSFKVPKQAPDIQRYRSPAPQVVTATALMSRVYSVP
jgi:hypothetical protein